MATVTIGESYFRALLRRYGPKKPIVTFVCCVALPAVPFKDLYFSNVYDTLDSSKRLLKHLGYD